MAPRLISLASTKTSPKNMGHGQRIADWGDRRLSGTIVPTCDLPIGDGPGREANVNGAGKEDAVNYKNNPLRQASKCAGEAGCALNVHDSSALHSLPSTSSRRSSSTCCPSSR